MALLTPAYVFRKFVTDGVPASGAHDPSKDEIIQLLDTLFGTSRGGWVVAATKAELDGVTPENETDGGVVLDDPTASNNGYYQRDAGAWVRERGFPDTFARVTLGGTANAQTGTVSTGVNPADIEVFIAFVTTENTGAMTLSIGGETPRDVVNAAGSAFSAGEWTGVVLFVLNDDGDYQLIIDAGAAASAAQSATEAAADADRAETAADTASAVMATVLDPQFATFAAAQAYSPAVAPDYIRTAGYTTAGDFGGALYKNNGTATGDLVITLDDAVTQVGYDIAETVLTPFMFGALADGSDEGPLLQSVIDRGLSIDLALGNFVTHQQLRTGARGQKIFNAIYALGKGSITAGAPMDSVIRIDHQWCEISNIGIACGPDSATRHATKAVIYYNGGRSTVTWCDILWAGEDGIYFDLDADTPAGNNNLARVLQNDIRDCGRDGINIPRKGPAEGDQNGITILRNNIRQCGRHGIYTDAMGTFIDFNHIESNAQGGTGWGIYPEPTSANGTLQVIPVIGQHNWIENGGDGNIFGWGAMQWAQTGAIEARTINAAPIKGNISRNPTFRHAQDGGTSISADGYFCDIWRVLSGGATFSLSRVNPDASLGRTKFGGAPYVAELNISAFGAGSFRIGQAFPNVSTLAGQGITVSFNAQSPAGDLCFIRVEQNFGSGGSATVIVDQNLVLSNISAGGGRLPTYANLIIPPIDGKAIGTNSFLAIYLHIANTKSTGVYRFSGFDIRPGLTPPPMMEIPDFGDELARLQQLFWKRTGIRWQGDVTSGVPYAVSVDMPRMIRVPSLTLTGTSQLNFPSGAPTVEGLTENGFAAVKTADGTGNGNFIFAAVASARL